MDNQSFEAQSVQKLPGIKRAGISSAHQALVKAEFLSAGDSLPLVIYPAAVGVDLAEWAKLNKKFIETELLNHGAILFRGFNLTTVGGFDNFLHGTPRDSP